MAQYEVIVGNVGTIYSGTDKELTEKRFDDYMRISQAGIGRAGNEPVTLMKDGEIYIEYEV